MRVRSEQQHDVPGLDAKRSRFPGLHAVARWRRRKRAPIRTFDWQVSALQVRRDPGILTEVLGKASATAGAVNNILVVLLNPSEFAAVLDLAGQIATQTCARLTVVAYADASSTMWLTPEGIAERIVFQAAVEEWLRDAVARVPSHVSVTSLVIDSSLASVVDRMSNATPYDLVLLSAKSARQRTVRNALAVLSVPRIGVDVPMVPSLWRGNHSLPVTTAEGLCLVGSRS
jgi:hypothetical protein